MYDPDFDIYDNEPRGRVHPGLLVLAVCVYLAGVIAVAALAWWLS